MIVELDSAPTSIYPKDAVSSKEALIAPATNSLEANKVEVKTSNIYESLNVVSSYFKGLYERGEARVHHYPSGHKYFWQNIGYGPELTKRSDDLFRGYLMVEPEDMAKALGILAKVAMGRKIEGKSTEFKWLQMTYPSVNSANELAQYLADPKNMGKFDTLRKTDPRIVIYADQVDEVKEILEQLSQDPQWEEIEGNRIQRSGGNKDNAPRRPGTNAFIDSNNSEWRSLNWNDQPGYSEYEAADPNWRPRKDGAQTIQASRPSTNNPSLEEGQPQLIFNPADLEGRYFGDYMDSADSSAVPTSQNKKSLFSRAKDKISGIYHAFDLDRNFELKSINKPETAPANSVVTPVEEKKSLWKKAKGKIGGLFNRNKKQDEASKIVEEELKTPQDHLIDLQEQYFKDLKNSRSYWRVLGSAATRFLGKKTLDTKVRDSREAYLQKRNELAVNLALNDVFKDVDYSDTSALKNAVVRKAVINKAAAIIGNWEDSSKHFELEYNQKRKVDRAINSVYKHPLTRGVVGWGLNIGIGVSAATGLLPVTAGLVAARVAWGAMGSEGLMHKAYDLGSSGFGDRKKLSENQIKKLKDDQIARKEAYMYEDRMRKGIVISENDTRLQTEKALSQRYTQILSERVASYLDNNQTGHYSSDTIISAFNNVDNRHQKRERALKFDRRWTAGRWVLGGILSAAITDFSSARYLTSGKLFEDVFGNNSAVDGLSTPSIPEITSSSNTPVVNTHTFEFTNPDPTTLQERGYSTASDLEGLVDYHVASSMGLEGDNFEDQPCAGTDISATYCHGSYAEQLEELRKNPEFQDRVNRGMDFLRDINPDRFVDPEDKIWPHMDHAGNLNPLIEPATQEDWNKVLIPENNTSTAPSPSNPSGQMNPPASASSPEGPAKPAGWKPVRGGNLEM